jgi:hypothetical protein
MLKLSNNNCHWSNDLIRPVVYDFTTVNEVSLFPYLTRTT